VNALTRAPDVFRAGVAVAPVTDWRLYDTIYTERYMGLPEANASGYDSTSAVKNVGAYRGGLLLLHGTADDNVHPLNTTRP
jgi:dipeptidyl-peptidase-4